jgi:hypothetical protein
MKVESLYAGPYALDRHLFRPKAQVYYYTGERVGPGRYVCTFCGKDTVADKSRVLPPCNACDSSEFALDAAAA